MSTRSVIAFRDLNGTISSIYCHSDGYPSHNGKILLDHYETPEKVRDLVALGHLSILGEVLGQQVEFNNARNHRGQCIAYGRDRGESLLSSRANLSNSFEQLQRESSQEYTYLFDQFTSTWFVAGGDSQKMNVLALY